MPDRYREVLTDAEIRDAWMSTERSPSGIRAVEQAVLAKVAVQEREKERAAALWALQVYARITHEPIVTILDRRFPSLTPPTS